MTAVADGVRRSSLWSAVNTVLMRLVNIVVMAVVARLIIPEQFGVFALTLVAFGMIQSLSELGVSAAIARRDLDLDEIAPTITTITWIASGILAVLMFSFARPLALALGTAEATLPLQIMAVCILLAGPFSIPVNQLQREFRGDLVFRANLIAFPFSTAALLGFAALGNGAVAFALSRVVAQIIVGIALLASVPRRYRPGFSRTAAGSLLRFGLPISLASLLSQVLLNVDFVLVGRLLSVRDVGLYNLAFNVSTWSTAVLAATLNSVVLPAFSDVLRAGGDARPAMRRAVEATMVLALPIAAVTCSLAQPLIAVVYGERWSAAAPVLVVLSIYGAVSVVGLLMSGILIASGRTGVLATVQACALALLIPVMWGAITLMGLIGAGTAHVMVVLVGTLPLYLIAIRRAIRVGAGAVLAPIAWPFSAAVVAGACGYAITLLPMPHVAQLLAGGVVIGLVYVPLTAPALRRLLPDSGTATAHLRRVLDVLAQPADRIAARRAQTEAR